MQPIFLAKICIMSFIPGRTLESEMLFFIISIASLTEMLYLVYTLENLLKVYASPSTKQRTVLLYNSLK